MCGIAGIIDQRVSCAVLEKMAARLAHRGPDGQGVSVSPDRRVGLAHRRLAIIDLTEHGAQPMRSERGTEIVFNGEIYNYVELRQELQGLGVRFQSTCDTEVLLAAYDKWGSSCLERLNGMFAFGVYDPRRNEVFLARDRFGEKPLFYWDPGDGRFAFASEIKALFDHPSIPAKPNDEAIYRVLAYRELDRAPATLFEGVRSLPPAHAMQIRLDTATCRVFRYWQPSLAAERTEPAADLIEEFRSLLADSVRIRLRSDVPVGSSLSGGLDSSALVGLIATSRPGGGQHTFSARFPGWELDEGKYIGDVNRMWDARAHAVVPTPERIPEEIEALTYHQDEPFMTLSVYAQWCVMRCAMQEGVTVLLDGQGADELLAGYQSYAAYHFQDLLRGAGVLVLPVAVARHIRSHGVRSLPALLYHLSPQPLALAAKRLVRAVGLSREFAARFEQLRPEEPPARLRNQLDSALLASLSQSVLPSLLRYADRNSMAFSREVRLPFLDHRLVEFAFSLPTSLKIDRGRSKVVLREAVRDVLPASVAARRDKIGYAPPNRSWLRGPLKEWAGDLLHSQAFAQRAWIDARRARTAWDEFAAGANRFEPDVLRWLSLEVWARLYFSGKYQEASPRTITPGH